MMTDAQKKLVIAFNEFGASLAALTAASLRLDAMIKKTPPDSDPSFEELRKRFEAVRPLLVKVGIYSGRMVETLDPNNRPLMAN